MKTGYSTFFPSNPIKKILGRIYRLFILFDFDPLDKLKLSKNLIIYFKNYLLLRESINQVKLEYRNKEIPQSIINGVGFYPALREFKSEAGNTKSHYFHQDLLVANYIYNDKPEIHFDIGSRLDGFIAHLLSFEQNTLFADNRNDNTLNNNLKSIKFDLTSDLDKKLLSTFSSVSCLHAIEHMGLGRYGDPINIKGHYIAIKNLSLLLKENGTLYLSYPFSKVSRYVYNSHRVISLKESKQLFKENSLIVDEFSYVNDEGKLIKVKDINTIDYESSYGLFWGCAIWKLKKSIK